MAKLVKIKFFKKDLVVCNIVLHLYPKSDSMAQKKPRYDKLHIRLKVRNIDVISDYINSEVEKTNTNVNHVVETALLNAAKDIERGVR